MPTTEAPATELIKYSVTDAEIAALRERVGSLTVAGDGYESVRLAISEVRDLRVAVEKRRVELKADALAWGRKVDTEAKRITTLLSAIEDPLKVQKDAVDAEKERQKQAAIDAKRLEMEAQLRAEREAEDARLKALRDAEEARLAEERARLDSERRALDEARRQADAVEAERREQERQQRAAEEARLRAERDALEAERRAVQQERERAEREEFERQARVRAEREAAEAVERERVAKIAREAELQALLPDIERVHVFTAAIRALTPPKVKAKKVAALVSAASIALSAVASELDQKAGAL